ncbi:MAG: hypothetical protein RL557_657 [archaeon]|jgi:ribulose-phosphate 3-epimerase
MEKIIIPAIIAQNQKEFDERISKVIYYADAVQLDVMDGTFVKNKSLLFDVKLPPKKGLRYEAHLMMKNPLSWIKKNHKKVDAIIVHAESQEAEKTILLLKKLKKKIGLAINPDTFLSRLQFLPMKKIDMILIMTVEPGTYGSTFLSEAVDKIKQARTIYRKKDIEVDGGIDDKTVSLVNHAGANRFVVGSFLQKSKDVEKDWKRLERKIR